VLLVGAETGNGKIKEKIAVCSTEIEQMSKVSSSFTPRPNVKLSPTKAYRRTLED
jgi:hypothetical protein